MRIVVTSALFALLCSCAGSRPAESAFDKLTDDFLYGTLALAPASATQSGYHQHHGANLDEALDDYSPAGIVREHAFFSDIQTRLAALDVSKLDKEQQADVRIMRDGVTGQLYELDTIQAYRHNPTVYVELAGNALYVPYVLNYAPKEQRFSHIIRRMEKLPTLMTQARGNLLDAPEVWNRVAREENEGNIELIDKTLRAECPPSLQISYNSAAAQAIAALKSFSDYLEKDLSQHTSDWRLGKEKYAKKFDYVLETGKTPQQLLAEAEADVKATHAEMQKLVAPKTIRQALDEIAQKHSTQESYMDDAKKTLAEATEFVKQKRALQKDVDPFLAVSVPGGKKMYVIERWNEPGFRS